MTSRAFPAVCFSSTSSDAFSSSLIQSLTVAGRFAASISSALIITCFDIFRNIGTQIGQRRRFVHNFLHYQLHQIARERRSPAEH